MRLKKIKNVKNWKLKCFTCGHRIQQNEEFYRDRFGVYCEEHGIEIMVDRELADESAYYDEQEAKEYKQALGNWEKHGRKGPRPLTREEREIDEVHKRKYREY